MKNLINLCAQSFIPGLPFLDGQTFIREFKNLQIGQGPLKNVFTLHFPSFFCAIHESTKTHANFVFIEQKETIHFMLHLSDFQNSIGIDDKLYTFQTQDGDEKLLFVKEESDLTKYITERIKYRNGLGNKINNVTKVKNTEVVSYKTKDILSFYMNNYDRVQEKLEFNMIQFKSIPSTNEDLALYYNKNNRQLSFVVALPKEEEIEYFNFGHRIP